MLLSVFIAVELPVNKGSRVWNGGGVLRRRGAEFAAWAACMPRCHKSPCNPGSAVVGPPEHCCC
eukprot:11756400-Prorocentrum_lima.AAC.2